MNNAVEVYRQSGDVALVSSQMPAAPPREDKLDLRAFWSMLQRRLGIFFGVMALVLTAVLVVTYLQTPLYTAAAEVALNQRDEQIAPDSSASRISQSEVPSNPLVDTQVQIITSRMMAERVVDALGLGRNPPAPASSGGIVASLKGLFGVDPDPVPGPAARRERSIQTLQNGVTATRIGETLAISISYSGPDAAQAAKIVNEYANQYAGGSLRAKERQNVSAAQFLERRVAELRARAQADQAAVQGYRIRNNLLSTSGASLTEQEISSYNQEVAGARAQAAEDQAALNTARQQLRGGSTGDDVGAALGSSVVSQLRSRQADVAGEVANLRARYGPRHPDVIKAQSQLADLDGKIQAEIGRVISNLEAKSRVSQQRLGSLSGSLSGAQGKLAQNNQAMVQLGDLERTAQASQALYEDYLRRYRETGAREGTEQADATVLSLSTVPRRPSSPKVMLNAALGLALGLGLGLAAALIAETSFSGLTTGQDVESRLHVRYLGLIPTAASVIRNPGSPIIAVADHPRSAFAESLRGLRASIAFATNGKAQVIAVTSSLPQEGKTTTAICLARSTAMAGERVVLVDCDLRRQGVSRYLRQAEAKPGLIEVLRGEADFTEALIVDERTGMSVLSITSRNEHYDELLTDESMDRLITRLRARFDVVIMDTAPLLPIADARLIVGKADAALMVVRWRKTPEHAVQSALRLLPRDRVALSGVALSRVDMKKQAKFGYGDGGFYYDDYKGYYG